MIEKHIAHIASAEHLRSGQVAAAIELLDSGATVPFIARYRKEATSGLDEVTIISIRDEIARLRTLDNRRDAILKSLADRGLLTTDLQAEVSKASTLAELEDVYLPFRPKRRTRGTVAREQGLEPLATILFQQNIVNPQEEAAQFIDREKGVLSAENALAGARDIIAEWISENAQIRRALRSLFAEKAVLRSKIVRGKEEEGIKYKDYYDWQEPAATAPSHRILAIRRGASEKLLTFHVLPEEEITIAILESQFVKTDGETASQIRLAVRDSYKRLLAPAMETEMRLALKKRADEAAITVFAENLRNLLLAPPLGRKRILAVDPGLRTGCKIVCLDAQGKLLASATIFPLEPFRKTDAAAAMLKDLADSCDIEAIAVGNGTGGREAEAFCRTVIFDRMIPIIMVSESGASVYSASEAGREEFPDHDVTVRGAVSIGRRLMDPLAELVKIDPKAIGVGQYQHDVDQTLLKKSLGDVVTSCVNAVGVELNTASKQLLSHVSGLSERLAESIYAFRNENGPFQSRAELLHVPGMGSKTFEQAAGFLRISESDNPLDASAVHPESYPIVKAMADDLGCTVSDLMRDKSLRDKIHLEAYTSDIVGIPTLSDIMKELAKPGRDPRLSLEYMAFSESIHDIQDLTAGMVLPGIVTNVTAFGAFVDIGVHQDGLVHISELADRFVKNPHDVVKVNQKVTVSVMNVDIKRKRISLSMRKQKKGEANH